MIPQKIKQLSLVLLYTASGVLFVLSIRADRLVLSLLGMPFFLLVVSAIHELGHAAGCTLNKNTITGFCTALFLVRDGRVILHDRLRLGGYCAFLKSQNDALVYLCGPLASLLCFLLCLLWWLLARPNPTAMLCALITGLHVLKNGLPHGHNDLQLLIKELTKGAPKV